MLIISCSLFPQESLPLLLNAPRSYTCTWTYISYWPRGKQQQMRKKKYFQHVAEGVGDKLSFFCLVWLYLDNYEKIFYSALSLSQKNVAQYRPCGFILFSPPYLSYDINFNFQSIFYVRTLPLYTQSDGKKWKILTFFILKFFIYAWLPRTKRVYDKSCTKVKFIVGGKRRWWNFIVKDSLKKEIELVILGWGKT